MQFNFKVLFPCEYPLIRKTGENRGTQEKPENRTQDPSDILAGL